MREELDDTVNGVANQAFGRLTENIANVDAKTVQNTRQLVELRQEMAQQTTLRGTIEALTAELGLPIEFVNSCHGYLSIATLNSGVSGASTSSCWTATTSLLHRRLGALLQT